MMGNKKLSEIRRELYDALRPKKAQIEAWLDQEMAKPSDKERRDPKAIENLIWIRDTLRKALQEKKRRERKTKKAKGKTKAVSK